jgi:hypothetical protein
MRTRAIQDRNFKELPVKSLVRLRQDLVSYAAECASRERYQEAREVLEARKELDAEIDRQEELLRELNERFLIAERFAQPTPIEYVSSAGHPQSSTN